MKPLARESRFDFRGGRNTSVSPDRLNPDELLDTTNARLVAPYGAVTKRAGSQRVHPNAFAAPVRGVFQWDGPNGPQTVVIAGGELWFRDGTTFASPFAQAASAGVARSSAAQGSGAGWTDPDGTNNGENALTVTINTADQTVAAGDRLFVKVGDPTADTNADAIDDVYRFSVRLIADGTGLAPSAYGIVTSSCTIEVSTNGGGLYTATSFYAATSANIGLVSDVTFPVTLMVTGTPTQVWFRCALKVHVAGSGTGTGTGRLRCFATVYTSDNFPVTWTTGAAKFSLTECASFAPFRASTAGAPLVLYIASGGHVFSWNGNATLAQLDAPPNTKGVPAATALIPYHTRLFAISASPSQPGLLPKTVFWSKIGDATTFVATGLKSDGGAAVTDFLTGQQLTALEVIGSSLLLATIDSVMRFTGQSSDDIVIAQNTEGVSAEVGCVGPLALRRFENVAAFLAARGPYAATETAAVPLGEKVLPDFDALDAAALATSIVLYHRGRRELLFLVPGATDGGFNKTVFVYSTRLQAWYGPWLYSFAMACACNYQGASGTESVLVGCEDGFVRQLDVGTLDDVLADGTGGTAIPMTVELPPFQFGDPGFTKALNAMRLQATVPSGAALQLETAFDGEAFATDAIASTGAEERSYRIDLDGQGKRLRLRFTDGSAAAPILNGFVLEAFRYGRP